MTGAILDSGAAILNKLGKEQLDQFEYHYTCIFSI